LIGVLGGDYPAVYPALDMFMAPFLAKMAMDIDEVLVLQQQQQQEGGGGEGGESLFVDGDDTDVFLATFVALNAFGMLVCSVLCVLASHVKLANLALFLPYPVLCGFFSSVGLSIWMSSFKVDTGITVQHFWGSEHRLFLVTKHIPSLISGVALYFLAPKSPLYLIGIVVCTIVLAYSTMLLTGTSLHDAQTLGFFWEENEVVMSPQDYDYPMHLWSHGAVEKISWDAFMNGVPDVIAMGLIYLIRCSLQAAALKRNRANILRNKEAAATSLTHSSFVVVKDPTEGKQPKRKPKDVLEVLMQFANTQFVTAIMGGFAVIPSVGLSNTFVKIGAERRAPQLLACLLVLGCYLSDFRLISFVPKCTFSSLLVMASIDLLTNWFIKSFQKTGSEWFVIPFIVLASQIFGVLQSVALGVGISTLVFVSSFYQAGTVKYIANGLTIRSTIERHSDDNVWLDRNGDMIQTLVLQNYLFFGNATSVLKYISSMFDDVDVVDDSLLPPKPKYVILDMSIVSGMDISAVDCFADVTSLCKTQGCKLIISGASRVVRPALIAGGVKPASHPNLSFVPDLEVALGLAEDGLLKYVAFNEERIQKNHLRAAHLRGMSQVDIGLRLALKQIDQQHNLSFANHLQGLEKYTTAMDLKAGDQLDLPRGLYFVESGLIKSEYDTSASLTRGRQKLFATPVIGRSTDSIGQVTARSATIGRGQAALKNAPGMMSQFSHTFRLARVGPGFVIGCISEFTGQEIPGAFICMTESRVHYLPFETIEELEMSKPVLVMHLYKLLAHLGARRQELTIGQLSTLRSIMSSTAPSKPISRKAMAHLSMNLQA
jgi:MFS superfamily sulfate permease-like transporter